MKKVLSLILAFILVVISIEPIIAIESVDKDYNESSNARSQLEFQAMGQFSVDEKIDLVIELNDEYFSQFGKIIEAELIREDNNLERQIDFAKKANAMSLSMIKEAGINFDLMYEVEVIMVGFTGRATYGEALKMADLPFIKSVSIAPQYNAPEISDKERLDSIRMMNSRKMVGTDKLDPEEDGRGTIVAILDSGFDVTHPAFYLTDVGKKSAKLKSSTEIHNKGVTVGRWENEKVPFGYNYSDKNRVIADPESTHGQHVAGTAVGNETNVTIAGDNLPFKGIAPEAQLLAMRVFSTGRGTSPMIYIPAMDDAVKLGADSINMSLGSPAGQNSVVETTGIVDAIDRANNIGCVVAMAAGNEAQFGRSVKSPKAYNPDFGVVGSPSVASNGLSVANLQNDKILAEYGSMVQYDDTGTVVEKYAAVPVFGTDVYSNMNAKPVIDLGKISTADQAGDIAGKGIMVDIISLSPKYEIVNEQLIRDLAAKKPAFIVVYASSSDVKYILNMFDPIIMLPVYGISNSVAKVIRDNPSSKFSFTTNPSYAMSADKGEISDSSSWGVTADGDIKPDIMAPGGNIYSTVYNRSYAVMSGTSMATPHVAGGIALVRSRVEREFSHLTGSDKSLLIRNLLMSTATPHRNLETGALSSPRHQGAGLMELVGATTSDVILFDPISKETKVNVGDVGSSFDVSFIIKNLSSTPKSFKVTGFLTTDYVHDDFITLRPRDLGSVDGGNITINGGSEQTVTVRMDASKYEKELDSQMENGYFLDGHVILEATDSSSPNLSIPFVGFKGNFKQLPLVEPSIYDLIKKDRLPFYFGKVYSNRVSQENNFTHFVSKLGREKAIVGQMPDYDKENPSFTKIAISPNGDGNMDNAELIFTLLRNTTDMKAKLYKSENGKKGDLVKEIFSVGAKQTLDKNHNVYPEDPMSYWGRLFGPSQYDFFDFPIGSTRYDDGEYIYEISGKAASSDSYVEYDQFFYIDTVKPSGKNPILENNIFKFKAVDELTDVISVKVFVNGQEIKKTAEGYAVPNGTSLRDIKVEILDSAYNKAIINADEMPIDEEPDELKKQLINVGLYSKHSVTVTSSDGVGTVNIYKDGKLLVENAAQGSIDLSEFGLERNDKLTFVIKADGYEDVVTTRTIKR